MSNREAFLTMIAQSEGTQAIGDHGYNALFGSTVAKPLLFESYADHPRKLTFIPRIGDYTSAAGRYQILAHNFDTYRRLLDLPDFSPLSQDAIALQMMKERGALAQIDEGWLDSAVLRCANIWASFPTADYPGQRTNKMQQMHDWYTAAGGTLNG